MFRRSCDGCIARTAELVRLDSLLLDERRRHDAELAEMRKENRMLVDRLTALVHPPLVSLQGDAPRKPKPSFATDPEYGTSIIADGKEVPIAQFMEDGTPMVKIIGDSGEEELVPLEQWTKWKQRMENEAAGVSPAGDA